MPHSSSSAVPRLCFPYRTGFRRIGIWICPSGIQISDFGAQDWNFLGVGNSGLGWRLGIRYLDSAVSGRDSHAEIRCEFSELCCFGLCFQARTVFSAICFLDCVSWPRLYVRRYVGEGLTVKDAAVSDNFSYKCSTYPMLPRTLLLGPWAP